MEVEESVGSSDDIIPFINEPNILDDMEIDSFTVDGELMLFECATSSVTLPKEFMMQHSDDEKDMVEIQETRGALPLEDEKPISGVTIQATRLNISKRVIMKPSVEANRHIKPLYIRSYLNGKPFSSVLIDNGLVVNIMPLRLLHSLDKGEGKLIATNITVAAFTGEVIKIIGVLPA